MTNMIEARELVKRYSGAAEPAVRGLSFAVRQGEIFSLLGPNGAGKTTCISMLSGLIEPTSGDAKVAGHSLSKEPLQVKQVIGVVPQEIALYPKLSARENMYFWGRMYGMGGAELRSRVEALLEIVGLQDRAKERVETFSGGMQRRINIAVGLLHRPQIIFMDEPTVGVDPQSRRNILETVRRLNEQGLTVLYTTHYMEEAQELSHRIGIIDHGQLIALGTLQELTQLVEQEDVVALGIREERTKPELLAALGAVAGVREVCADNGTVSVLVVDGNAALPELITVANAHGVRVAKVTIKEANLEAVFLHLTGRALRD